MKPWRREVVGNLGSTRGAMMVAMTLKELPEWDMEMPV